jgi:hypothetical protein
MFEFWHINILWLRKISGVKYHQTNNRAILVAIIYVEESNTHDKLIDD